MEKLIELAKLVSKEKTKRVNIIGQEKKGNSSLTKKLYDGIVDGKITDDKEAGELLYGQNFDKNTYVRTKYRLEEKLVNSLFFINLNEPHFTDFQKNYYKCHKDAAAVKFLLGKSARNAGVALAEKTIRLAIKYEFTEIILSLGRILKAHFRLFNPNKEKANFYIKLISYHKEVLDYELLAEDFREEISSQFSPSRANQAFQREKVNKYEIILREKIKEFSSYRLQLNYYLIASFKYRITNNHTEVIRVCQEALHYFEKITNKNSIGPIAVFSIDILFSCVISKNYDLGNEIFKKVNQILPEGSINWFSSLEGYILLCFHTKKYIETFEIQKLATKHKKYAQLPKQYSEIWKVYNAYCHFLLENNKLDLPKKNIRPFRIAKFLNEVPQFSKDKKGINISILIIHVLFLLQRKKRDAIVERIDALKQYSYRYLIKDETLRSNCFIKMLAKMVKASFHKNATIRTTKRLYERLAKTPSASKGQSQYVEIIPYEVLWDDIILGILVNRAM